MKRLTIKTLLIALGCATVAAFATIFLLFFTEFRHIGQSINTIVNQEEALLAQMQEMYAQGLQTEQGMRNIVLSPGDGTAQNNFTAAHNKFQAANKAALQLATPALAEDLNKIAALWAEAHHLKLEVINLAQAGNIQAATDLLTTKETQNWRTLKDALLKCIEAQSTKSKKIYAEFQSGVDKSMVMGIGIALFISISIACLLLKVAHMILAPLKNIKMFAQAQAKGNFEGQIEGEYSGELKDVVDALSLMSSKMNDSLGYTRGTLSAIATPFLVVTVDSKVRRTNKALTDLLQTDVSPDEAKDMDVSLFFYGEKGRKTVISDAMETLKPIQIERDMVDRKGAKRHVLIAASPLFNEITKELVGGLCLYTDMTDLREKEVRIIEQNNSVLEAAKAAEGIIDALLDCSQRLADIIHIAEKGADEQKEHAEATVRAMSEMGESIRGASESADGAAAEANNAGMQAAQGQTSVSQVVTSVESVRVQAISLKDTMSELGRRAESIGNVMNVISDIADQTNLLALNAAIEAARAGDAGRGFAVVADEVRKLAEKTMGATHEVEEVVTNIQMGTRNNVLQMDTAASTIEETTALAQNSGDALGKIVSMVQETIARVRSIGQAVELQISTSSRVDAAVRDINSIATTTAEGMTEAARSVDELRGLADKLQHVVAGMRKK